MAWEVELHAQFVPEFEALAAPAQDELLAHVAVLEVFGPQLGRPRVDTLFGSRHSNMKELRFDAADGVWRFAFAFDPRRRASCSAAVTSPEGASGGSTATSSTLRTSGSTRT